MDIDTETTPQARPGTSDCSQGFENGSAPVVGLGSSVKSGTHTLTPEDEAPRALNPKLKRRAYMYEYESPNPAIREKFKQDLVENLAAVEEVLPMVQADEDTNKVKALNPKLTRRAYVYDYVPPRPDLRENLVRQLQEGTPPADESDSENGLDVTACVDLLVHQLPCSEEKVDMGAGASKKILHTGHWNTPQYVAGKLQKDTGMWSCCGSREQHSLYCTSLKDRISYEKKAAEKIISAKTAAIYAKKVEEERRGPWERQEISAVEQEPDSTVEQLMQKANSEDSSLNGPMLISWTHKNCASQRTALSGLNYLLRTLFTGEGCVLFHRHEGCETILKAYNLHPKDPEILLTSLKLWCQLLDCNFTRDFLLNDTVVLQAVFSIANRYMRSEPHVACALRCLMQCSRAEVCRIYILENNLLGYYTLFCKSFPRKPEIIRSVLRSFNWVATTDDRLVTLFKLGCIKTTIKCMERNLSNSSVIFHLCSLNRFVATVFYAVGVGTSAAVHDKSSQDPFTGS